ncbi:MAG TPA: hypothetical protein VFK89_03195 [Actinomycetota bacterium]|nr:hypothetical protein [Actinomycetota bacterium]
MNLSLRAKVFLLIAALIGATAYLIIMDLGINAGRVHYGVTVEGLQVGGQTLEEAVATIRERGRELRDTPVVLTTEGFDCRFLPTDLGWRVRPQATADEARDVGFSGAPFGALADRIRAWFGGVAVEWQGGTKHEEVNALLADCERQAQGLGLTINRFKLRRRINRAIVTWPRRNFVIPIADNG